jgi:hypothetical protein
VLFFPVYTASDPRLFTLSLEGLILFTLSCEGNLKGLHSLPVASDVRFSRLTRWPRLSGKSLEPRLIPLESALTQKLRVTLLESALLNLKDLKSFGINTYRKGRGRGVNC